MSEDLPSPIAARPLARAAAALALLSTLLFLDVLLAGNVVASSDHGDTFAYFARMRAFGFGEMARGHLALWNPYVFSGTPFLAGFQSALLYPLNFIYLLFPVGTAVDLDLALHVFLGGIFTYAWAAGRGIRPLGAFLAACVLVFGSAFFLRVLAGQLTLVAVMAWSPLLMLAVDRVIERPSLGWTLVGILATTLMILAGYPAGVYATAVAVGLSIAVQLPRSPAPGRALPALASIGLAPLLLSAAQLWPGLATAGETLRAGGVPFDFATSFSFPPENLITLVVPSFFGDVTLLPYWGRWYYWDVVLYIGVVGLLFAVHGALHGRRSRTRFALPIALLLVVVALGSYTPLYRLLFAAVPGFDTFRAPSKFAFQASLFLALLAGEGADRLLASARGARGLAIGAFGIAIGLAAGAFWARHTGLTTEGATLGHLLDVIKHGYAPSFSWRAMTVREFGLRAGPFVAGALGLSAAVAAVAGGLLWWRPRGPAIAVGLIGLAVVEVFAFAATHRDRFPLDQIPVTTVDVSLKRLPKSERFYYALEGNRAMNLRAGSIWGYDPVMLGRYGEFVAKTQPNLGAPIDLTVAYPGQFHPIFALLRCRLNFRIDTVIESRLDPMPRFVLMRDYRVIPDASRRLGALFDPGFDWRRAVIVEEPLGELSDLPPDSGEPPLPTPVRVEDVSTDAMDLEVDLDEPAVLLVTDSYSRGWRARPLGPSAQETYRVLPADHTLRAIPLRAGHHHFRLEYAPASFAAGRVASLASGAVYLGVVAVWWRRRRRNA